MADGDVVDVNSVIKRIVIVGERIVCVNAETGKDNKFAGKMQGPYGKLLPLTLKDTMLAIPHLSRQFHLLKLSGDVCPIHYLMPLYLSVITGTSIPSQARQLAFLYETLNYSH